MRLTSVEAEVGAPVCHVEIYTTGAIGVLQDFGEGVHHLLGAVVRHALSPMSQPACAAKQGRQ